MVDDVDLGLADALQWALAQQAKTAGWKTEIDADDLPVAIPADVQTACFRIGQEALANAARHAGAGCGSRRAMRSGCRCRARRP